MTYAKFARFAALGAGAVTLGLIALFALFAYITRPTPTGGMNWSITLVTWASVGIVFGILILVHLIFARELHAASRAPRLERRAF